MMPPGRLIGEAYLTVLARGTRADPGYAEEMSVRSLRNASVSTEKRWR